MRKFETGFRDQLDGIFRDFSASLEPVLYEVDQIILPPTTEPADVAFIVDGLVLAESTVKINGKTSTPAWSVFGDLSWIGLECLMDGGGLGYRAMIPSRAVIFPVSYVLEEMSSDLRLAVLAQMADRNLESMSRNIGNRGSLMSRVLITLLLVRSVTALPEVSLTLADLANLSGASRTRLTPIMKQFESQGLIDRGYKNYMIAPTAALLEALGELSQKEELPEA